MSRRLFSFILVVLLCASLLISVSAAEVDYSQVNTTSDLLKSSNYQITGITTGDETHTDIYFNSDYTSPIFEDITVPISGSTEWDFFTYSDLQEVIISWKPAVKTVTSKIFFYFTVAPNNTSVNINGMNYSLNYSDQTSQYSAYYVPFTRATLINDITVTFSNTGDATFTKAPGVISAFCFNHLSENFTRASLNAYNTVYHWDTDDLLYVDREDFIIDQTVTPGLNSSTAGFAHINDFYEEGAQGVLLTTAEICVDLQQIGPDYLNFFKMDYCTVGYVEEVSAWVGSDRFDPHENLTNLTVNNIVSEGSIFEFAFPDAEIQTISADNYSLFIDLNGIDLKSYRYLNISITIEPAENDRDFGTLSFLNINELTGYYSVTFDASETIVLTHIHALLMNSDSILATVRLIQEYFEVSDVQKDDIAESAGGLTDQSNQLNEVIGQLGQVDRPEINLDSLLGQTGLEFGVMPTHILSVITNNKYIFPLLLLSFVLCLAAYLLFGRR